LKSKYFSNINGFEKHSSDELANHLMAFKKSTCAFVACVAKFLSIVKNDCDESASEGIFVVDNKVR
jgi:hypothetical protein